MELKERLIKETLKWKDKLDDLDIETSSENDNKNYVKNIKAYIEDSEYFLEEEKYVEAFEAVIWAWAWYEIGKEENLL